MSGIRGLLRSGAGALFLFFSVTAAAETVVVRGRVGPVVPRRANANLSSFRRLGPTLFSSNGRLGEVSNGRFRPLSVNRATGDVSGATDARTLSSLRDFVARNINRYPASFQPIARQIVRSIDQRFGNQGFDPFDQAPFVAENAPPPFNGCGGVSGEGGHGAGRCGPGNQSPGNDATQRRGNPRVDSRSSAANPIGPDGTPTREACLNMSKSLCGLVDPGKLQKDAFARGKAIVDAFIQQPGQSRDKFGRLITNFPRNQKALVGDVKRFADFAAAQFPAFAELQRNAKSLMLAEIARSPFSAAAKAAMTKKISGPPEMRITASPPTDGDDEALDVYEKQCGFGLDAGAYAIPDRNEVVVCPGMLALAEATGGSLVSNLLPALMHECTHNCGANGRSPQRNEFNRLRGCLASRFPNRPIARQINEIAADHMGWAAMAPELAKLSKAEAFAQLAKTVAPLCGLSGDQEHPDGNFRIDRIAEIGPIAESVGCSAPSAACSLSGQERELAFGGR